MAGWNHKKKSLFARFQYLFIDDLVACVYPQYINALAQAAQVLYLYFIISLVKIIAAGCDLTAINIEYAHGYLLVSRRVTASNVIVLSNRV